MTKYTIGISPCPNDTYIFEAIYNKRIDLEGLNFEFIFADVEELNLMAMRQELDITKISYNAYSKVTYDYQLLDSGSALGRNCGPLIIAKKPYNLSEINKLSIAIPGVNTTANLLLSIAFPNIKTKHNMIFSNIEKAVYNGDCDLGLIIHENRFTYADRGFYKIIDLGKYWEEKTGKPIPLGGISVKRSIKGTDKFAINRLINKSIKHAIEMPESTLEFVKAYAQELEEHVIKQHIALYVNEYSLDLGEKGRQAIAFLFETMVKRGFLEDFNKKIFLS